MPTPMALSSLLEDIGTLFALCPGPTSDRDRPPTPTGRRGNRAAVTARYPQVRGVYRRHLHVGREDDDEQRRAGPAR